MFAVGALRARRSPGLYTSPLPCSFHSPGKDTHVGLRAAVEQGPLYFPKPLLRGVAKAPRVCEHRATTCLPWELYEQEGHLDSTPHPFLVRFTLPGRTPMLVYVRPSSKALSTSLNLS